MRYKASVIQLSAHSTDCTYIYIKCVYHQQYHFNISIWNVSNSQKLVVNHFKPLIYFSLQGHSSNAMFISEIPVRCMSSTGNGEKTIKWIDNLNNCTTVRDIIISILPACDPTNYSLYIHTDRKKQILNYSARIYKIVAKINKKKSSRRLLFEIRKKKRVRFADEILVQNIVQEQCISNEILPKNIIETISIPLEKRLDKIKENFQKHIQQQQENYVKRSSLSIINGNISRSSSESGISSNSSIDDLIVPIKTILETLV